MINNDVKLAAWVTEMLNPIDKQSKQQVFIDAKGRRFKYLRNGAIKYLYAKPTERDKALSKAIYGSLQNAYGKRTRTTKVRAHVCHNTKG